MAVIPSRQKAGVGSELIKAGIQRCKECGYDAVVVLGHPEYYPKFGFAPSVAYGIRSVYEVPDNAFMVLELREGVLQFAQGVIHYHQAFSKV